MFWLQLPYLNLDDNVLLIFTNLVIEMIFNTNLWFQTWIQFYSKAQHYHRMPANVSYLKMRPFQIKQSSKNLEIMNKTVLNKEKCAELWKSFLPPLPVLHSLTSPILSLVKIAFIFHHFFLRFGFLGMVWLFLWESLVSFTFPLKILAFAYQKKMFWCTNEKLQLLF